MKISTRDLLLTVVSPLVITKLGVVYFGLMYSAYPGEGYGWWLTFFIVFTLFTLGRFIWKYRNYTD